MRLGEVSGFLSLHFCLWGPLPTTLPHVNCTEAKPPICLNHCGIPEPSTVPGTQSTCDMNSPAVENLAGGGLLIHQEE